MACSTDHSADYGRNCQRVAGTGEAFALFFVESHRAILCPRLGLGMLLASTKPRNGSWQTKP
jgi:hypothetical protein